MSLHRIHKMLINVFTRYKTDGLVNLRYNLVGKTAEPLYTHIAVSIKPEKPKRGRPNFRVR